MNIKETLEGQIKRNEEILIFLNEQGRDYKKADNLINDYLQKFKEWNFDSALTSDFANCLQLSNVKENLNQYTLEDIRRLFQSVLNIQEYNIETYVEFAHFEYAVMDNKNEAEKIIDIGIKKVTGKIGELTNLKKTLQCDK